MLKKEAAKMPRPRHGWAINPKTRVKPSKKNYHRKLAKRAEKDSGDELLD